MHIRDILARDRTTFSFEFFPPKTDAASEELFRTIAHLQELQPSFVSVTYGAGGSTRDRTHNLVVRIQKETDLTAVSHLTCVCHSLDEMTAILDRYAAAGVENILALGGDPPKKNTTQEDREKAALHYAEQLVRFALGGPAPRTSLDHDRAKDAFQYADQLVAFVRSRTNTADKRGFGVGVAGFPEGHPGTPNRLIEMDHLKRKVDAGADYICTQLFFENRDFFDFRERCDLAGITVPIIAGIMPVSTKAGLVRMAELAAGARIPAGLLRAVSRCADDAAVEKVGVHWATEQCRRLLDGGVRGIHFYTLNKSDATRQIYQNLGVRDSSGLRS